MNNCSVGGGEGVNYALDIDFVSDRLIFVSFGIIAVDIRYYELRENENHKVNRCLARYSPCATTTNRPALFFGQALDQMGQKCRYFAINASFGPNLAVFGPKIQFLGDRE